MFRLFQIDARDRDQKWAIPVLSVSDNASAFICATISSVPSSASVTTARDEATRRRSEAQDGAALKQVLVGGRFWKKSGITGSSEAGGVAEVFSLRWPPGPLSRTGSVPRDCP